MEASRVYANVTRSARLFARHAALALVFWHIMMYAAIEHIQDPFCNILVLKRVSWKQVKSIKT